jgi:Fe-S cluster assembly ATP-binding protein
MSADLVIRDLHVAIDGKEILKGINLEVGKGEVHAIMGPNGSGKSTLAYALMGHPKYTVTGGEILFKGHNIVELEPEERARLGLFLAFQYPTAVPGVSLGNFMRMAVNSVRSNPPGNSDSNGNGASNGHEVKKPLSVSEFQKLLREKMEVLHIDRSFASRYVNDGFSGGEKKRAEVLQMALLEPQIAVLDETDSGLDIDALRIVSEGVNKLSGPDVGIIVITHYQRILNYIKPQFVHVLAQGSIIRSGGPELALALEEKGYDWLLKEAGMARV